MVRRLCTAHGPCFRASRFDEPGDACRALDRIPAAGASLALERQGKKFDFTYEAHREAGLGEVWEEDEFWIELSWRVDPDGSMGIRRYFESPYRPGEKLRIDEYYRWIFENSVPGLPQAAASEGLAPLDYMRKYGAFLVENNVYELHRKTLKPEELKDSAVDPVTHVVKKHGTAIGVEVDGNAVAGFPTPSRKLEFYSKTLKDWNWPEHSIPGYIKSHVHRDNIDAAKGEMLLLQHFASRRSFIPGRATQNGSTKSRTRIRFGCIAKMPIVSVWSPAIWCEFKLPSVILWIASGPRKECAPASLPAPITLGAGV